MALHAVESVGLLVSSERSRRDMEERLQVPTVCFSHCFDFPELHWESCKLVNMCIDDKE
jgi:hypothetical protein